MDKNNYYLNGYIRRDATTNGLRDTWTTEKEYENMWKVCRVMVLYAWLLHRSDRCLKLTILLVNYLKCQAPNKRRLIRPLVLRLNFKDIDQPDLHRSEPSSSQTLRGEHPNRITTKLLVTGVWSRHRGAK